MLVGRHSRPAREGWPGKGGGKKVAGGWALADAQRAGKQPATLQRPLVRSHRLPTL